jgi:hypothetical protein
MNSSATRMLWYKAWLETRTRFLIALLGITVLCSLMVYENDGGQPVLAAATS